MRTARRERALFLITISTSWSTAVNGSSGARPRIPRACSWGILRQLEQLDVMTPAIEAAEAMPRREFLPDLESLRPEQPNRSGHSASCDSLLRQGELQIELKGNLAAMLGATVQTKRSPETGDLSLQVVMVAGAGFEPATFGL
jgi:hypothetical protein